MMKDCHLKNLRLALKKLFLSLPGQPEQGRLGLVKSSSTVVPGTELFWIRKTKAKKRLSDVALCRGRWGMCQSPQKHFSSSFGGCISCQFISCLQPKNMILKPTIRYVGFQGAYLDPEIEFQAVALRWFLAMDLLHWETCCAISQYIKLINGATPFSPLTFFQLVSLMPLLGPWGLNSTSRRS